MVSRWSGRTHLPNRARSSAVEDCGRGVGSSPTARSTCSRVAGWCSAARNRASCSPAWSRSIESMTLNSVAPRTRLVTSSTGLVLLATISGRNGTSGSPAKAASTPISCARRCAAGPDQANFATNSSPRQALDDRHSGSSLPTSSGSTIRRPASSGATTRSASSNASTVYSASHLTGPIFHHPNAAHRHSVHGSELPLIGRMSTLR
jgi:hypothetical protein